MSFHKLSGKSATEQKEDRDRMINDLVNQGGSPLGYSLSYHWECSGSL